MAMSLTHTALPGGILQIQVRDGAGNLAPINDLPISVNDGGSVVAVTTNTTTSCYLIEGVGVGSATVTVNDVDDIFNGAAAGTFAVTSVANGTEFVVTAASGTLTIL